MTTTFQASEDAPQHRAPKKRGMALPAVLIGLGALLLGLAILLPTVVISGVKKTPLDATETESIAQGTGKVFNAETGEIENYDNVTASRHVTIDINASDGDVAVFVATLCVRTTDEKSDDMCHPEDDDELLSYSYDRVATDRVTGLAVNDSKYKETTSEGEVDGTKHKGLTYKFPFDVTADGDYQMFNSATGGTTKAEFVREDEIQGVDVLVFEADFGVHEAKIKGTFPGTIHNVNTYFVEPNTGIVIRGDQIQTQKFENGDLAGEVNVTFTKDTVDKNVAKANDSVGLLDLVRLWLPLAAAILGIALVVSGLLLVSKRRRAAQPEYDPYATPA